MEPQIKTGIDPKSFALGAAVAFAGSIAVAILAARKDKIVYFNGEAHLLVRPITATGDHVLNTLAQSINLKAIETTVENYID